MQDVTKWILDTSSFSQSQSTSSNKRGITSESDASYEFDFNDDNDDDELLKVTIQQQMGRDKAKKVASSSTRDKGKKRC